MNLEIVNIENAGELARERLVLKASADLDVGVYVVFRGRNIGEEKIQSGRQDEAYWFPDKQIKSGDLVILYTKVGTTSEKVLDTGRTARFYYWQLDHAIWTKGHSPVVIDTKTYKFGPRL
jgi:hypothetical protein